MTAKLAGEVNRGTSAAATYAGQLFVQCVRIPQCKASGSDGPWWVCYCCHSLTAVICSMRQDATMNNIRQQWAMTVAESAAACDPKQ